MDYSGTDFELNGYYYHKYETGYVALFFFRNGVIYDTNAMLDLKDLEELDTHLRENYVGKELTQLHWFWGVYKVDGNEIRIDHWLPGTGGPYPTEVVQGRILNSTTLEIPWFEKDGNINQFRFREFSPKPDSTNTFIE